MRKRRVLIVDDDAALLRLLSMRLTAAGFQATAVKSGEEALGCLTAFKPQLVITDLRMEGMGGMALFEAIRTQDQSLPVIILTAHGSIPEAVDATKRGVFGYLTKPFDSMDLLDCVKQALKMSGGAEKSASVPLEDANWCAGIKTRSPLMADLLRQAKLAAQSENNVFIQGECGTGKELLARAIHKTSPRADQPFVAFNCTAVPETLLESELFGHAEGAFTTTTRAQSGLFKAAEGGTLFLNEIGELPIEFQVKLLRALAEREVRAVGSTESTPFDVRIVSASQCHLEELVEAGDFNRELFYRLAVVPLEIAPLAARREDIPLLVDHFLGQSDSGKGITGFSPDALELLMGAPWPGNVRELQNVVAQTVALATTPLVPVKLVKRALRDETKEMRSLSEARDHFERKYLAQILQMTDGNVSQAARIAKRNRTEFYKLLHRHHLDPKNFRAEVEA
jgi:two-component system response regulator GlrR